MKHHPPQNLCFLVKCIFTTPSNLTLVLLATNVRPDWYLSRLISCERQFSPSRFSLPISFTLLAFNAYPTINNQPEWSPMNSNCQINKFINKVDTDYNNCAMNKGTLAQMTSQSKTPTSHISSIAILLRLLMRSDNFLKTFCTNDYIFRDSFWPRDSFILDNNLSKLQFIAWKSKLIKNQPIFKAFELGAQQSPRRNSRGCAHLLYSNFSNNRTENLWIALAFV